MAPTLLFILRGAAAALDVLAGLAPEDELEPEVIVETKVLLPEVIVEPNAEVEEPVVRVVEGTVAVPLVTVVEATVEVPLDAPLVVELEAELATFAPMLN